jgi:hypothetical protein
MIHGFDVSAYQGTSVPAADFVFVKATEGSGYTSSKFRAQWADAKRKARVRGAYHFARPEESSAAAQADRFLAVVKPDPGDLLCLDLEASDLSQAASNDWAIAFAARLKHKYPDNIRVAYFGRGYASNHTGKNLSQHYHLWWFPQYPSKAPTHTWPKSFTPAVPSKNTTGWEKPHIWQWTDNFGGLDANISPLTIDELAQGGQTGQDMAQVSSLGVDGKQTIAAGETGDVKWTKEYTDKHKLHGDAGTSIVIAEESFWALFDAQFMLSGLGPTESVEVAWTRVKDDGTYLDDAWGPFTFTADAAGIVHGQLGGQFGVDASNRVRLRVYNTSSNTVTVVATADGRAVTMAKATLLRY